MQDIADQIGQARVAAVVDAFYSQVQHHSTLAAPFAVVDNWPGHKAILTHFWWVSLGGKRYSQYPYAVARKHIEAGFTTALLADWLALFAEVISAELPPDLAAGWLERARKIGESLTYMVAFQQKQGTGPALPPARPA
jgi:hemoglobin